MLSLFNKTTWKIGPERTRHIALLAALCLFLATVEFIIPKPVPFMRIGLANLPIMIALFVLNPFEVLVLILLKVLGQGLVQGTLFSYIFIFSFCGSFTSGIVMLSIHVLFKHLKYARYSLIGISVAGALSSNIIQLLIARLFVFGRGILLIAPVFLIIGLITSLFLGFLAENFIQNSTWVALHRQKTAKSGR